MFHDKGLFFNVDSSKILWSDSLQSDVAARHFNRFKGMGLTLIVITDIFGHVIYMEVVDGNGADVIQWRQTDFYNQTDPRLIF